MRLELIDTIKKTITNFKFTMAGVELIWKGINQVMFVIVSNSKDTVSQAEIFVKEADYEEWYLEILSKIHCVFGYIDSSGNFQVTSNWIIKDTE